MTSHCDNPLVSILIPVYNREDLISESIQSALNQTYQNIEVIIADNCSTDNTVEIVKSYQDKDPRVKLFQNEENLGPVMNWERCLNEASGQYAKILWSDDLIQPEFIASCLDLFNKESDVAFIFTKVHIAKDVNDPKADECYCHFPRTGIYDSRAFVKGIVADKDLPVSPGCAIFKTDILRKSFIKTNELFDNKYLQNGAGPDVLMYLMATTYSSQIGYINQPLSFFRRHDDSISVVEGEGLSLHYKKAIIWFLYHHINENLASAHYMFTKRSLRNKDKLSSAFCVKSGYLNTTSIACIHYMILSILKSRLYRVFFKSLFCLIPSKEIRKRMRRKYL